MRPVNLIPPEDRRGDHAPLRAGALSYVILGAIGAALVAVVALVLTQNSIVEKENQIGELEVAEQAATQRAQALAPYAEFASLQEERELTIKSLAESRFDWERVLRELALVIPADVSLTQLEAQTAGSEGADASTDTGSAPSLVMSGCATEHDAVARFVAALEDIDGVTRVGLESSAAPDQTGGPSGAAGAVAATTTPSEGGGAGCLQPSQPTSFTLTAVFDGVIAAAEAAAAPPSAAPTPPAPEAAGAPASGETNSAEEQVGEASEAADVVTGTAR
jgi:Tfp pilus assembly protein PilN